MPQHTKAMNCNLVLATGAVCLLLTGVGRADPTGSYQAWIWETGIFGVSVPGFGFSLSEEFCFGDFDLDIAGDLTWATDSTASTSVCWGRTTTQAGRTLDGIPFVSDPGGDSQSTRPLVSAGGQLFEIYGEDVEGGVGQGEQRFGTIMAPPSENNVLMVGGYQSQSVPGVAAESRFLDFFAKATDETAGSRVAADLEGTSWRMPVLNHGVPTNNVNVEVIAATIGSFSLNAGGVCAQSISDVFPEFTDNADNFFNFQFDDGVSLDDRYVRGGWNSRNFSNCTYSIDGDNYLVISRTLTLASDPGNPIAVTRRFVVSDDNRYLVPAPAAALADNTQIFSLAFRSAQSLPATAINGTYFFYLVITEFGADGAGAEAAGFGPRSWQELDGLGRGKFVFDSTTTGTTPDGETGNWGTCSIELTINEFEHEYTGSTADLSAMIGQDAGPSTGNVPFDDCSFALDSDGALSVYLLVDDPEGGFEGILRGYVNDSGELLALIQNGVGEDPLNPGNVFEDTADVKFVVGMKYAGNPDGDEDGDGLTNYDEFRYPLPVFPIVDQDTDGDGNSDILFRNNVTGANQLYLMNGAAIAQNLVVSSVSAAWQAVGRGDYNGDGRSDILWRYTPTGALWIYLMDGNTVSSSVFVGTVADANWKIVGNGDYNGDGKSDILWRHQTLGTVWLYEMDGNTILNGTGIGVVPDLNWKIVGSGDYNGDGNSDVLWRNVATGTNWMYLMQGATIAVSTGISVTPDLNWQIVGNGDYDGSGTSDILWRNAASGTNWVYLMDGTSIAASSSISVLPDLNWKVVGDGDYNGDGMADVLWRNMSTGTNYMYLMNGLAISSNAQVSVVTDQNWQIVNTN